MRIMDWPEQERPRERILTLGGDTLTNSEILALILKTGTPDQNALELSQSLLLDYHTFSALIKAPANDLMEVKGIGAAKTAEIKALHEMHKRIQIEEAKQLPLLDNPANVSQLVRYSIQDRTREEVWALLLNMKNKLIKIKLLSIGTINAFFVHPRELVKEALLGGATKIIVAHNHPSGDVTPSQQDKDLSAKYKTILYGLEITLSDYIIVGNTSYYSFARQGIL